MKLKLLALLMLGIAAVMFAGVMCEGDLPKAQSQEPAKKQLEPVKQKYATGYVKSKQLAVLRQYSVLRHGKMLAALPKATAASYDCRTLGIVPPIVDQGQCGSCFPAGTAIITAGDSKKSIESVVVGDTVLSAEGNWRAVKFVLKREVEIKLFTLKLANGLTLVGTSNHPVLTKNGYRLLRSLQEADEVATRSDGSNKIQWINIVSATLNSDFFKGLVYNLEVDVDHSFFANGIAVHNCWDFSGTTVCTSAYMKAYGTAAPGPLSEQYTLDCGQNGGCNGDDNVTVLAWAKATGLPSTADYGPYRGSPTQCKSGVKLYKIDDWGFCDGSGQGVTDTQKIKDAMVKYGTIGVAIAADDAFMNNPAGTVFQGSGSTDINHDVALVGWDDSKGAWILRNSWGTSWCDGGYCWIKYGANQVGTEAVWAVVNPPSPGPTPPVPPGPNPQPPSPAGAPTITSPSTLSGVINVPLSYQIAASNSPILYSAFGLPAGLTVSATGLISGTPTATGASSVTLLAANASGAGTTTLTLTVTATPVPPSGQVTLNLTADQVQDILDQVITKDMTLGDLIKRLDKAKSGIGVELKKPCSDCKDKGRLEAMEKEMADMKRATDAILKALLPAKESTPKKQEESYIMPRQDQRVWTSERFVEVATKQ